MIEAYYKMGSLCIFGWVQRKGDVLPIVKHLMSLGTGSRAIGEHAATKNKCETNKKGEFDIHSLARSNLRQKKRTFQID
jgi:hypothetical protein